MLGSFTLSNRLVCYALPFAALEYASWFSSSPHRGVCGTQLLETGGFFFFFQNDTHFRVKLDLGEGGAQGV